MAKLHQPPNRLRHLPEDLYTTDVADTVRIHRADPEHIIRSLMRQYLDAQMGRVDQGEKATAVGAGVLGNKDTAGEIRHTPGTPLPITEYIVDLIRMRTLIGLARQMAKYFHMPEMRRKLKDELQVRHLWFPENRATRFCLRPGPPPPPEKRPVWLKTVDLTIDLLDWPTPIRRMLKERGVDCEPILALLKAKAKKLIGQDKVVWTLN